MSDKLASAVTSNSSLEQLGLRNNKQTIRSIVTIAESLSCLSTLKLLNIRWNWVTERAADVLSRVILNNTDMEELWLGENKLQGGMLKILKALEVVPKLKALDIENNHLPENVYDELATFMGYNNVRRNLHTFTWTIMIYVYQE